MIDANVYYIAEYSLESFLPKRGPNVYESGLKDSEKGEVKFGPPSNDQPTLQIVAPIYDGNRNAIKPGYYELTINDDYTFLSLKQKGQTLAKIPVFKIEQDEEKSEELAKANKLPSSKYEAIKFKIKKKLAQRKRQKQLNNKEIEETTEIYNDASIEYDIKGDYYLIKYERGTLRAWGALKANW